jgi:hypothetical protein
MSKPYAPTAPEQDSLCGVAGRERAGRCSIRKSCGPVRLRQNQKGVDQQVRNEESIENRRLRMAPAQPVGCSKWPSSKAASESKPEAYPLGYVEDFDELRTKLTGFFNSLPDEEPPLAP